MPGANAELSADFVDRAGGDDRAMQAWCWRSWNRRSTAVEAAFVAARAAGVATVLNPAPADAVAPASLWALADVVTPNETEFCAQLLRHTGERIEPIAWSPQDDDTLARAVPAPAAARHAW